MLKNQNENPIEAIGKSKELIECCCKTICKDLNIKIDSKWDVHKLAKETLNAISLSTKSIPEKEYDDNTNKTLKSLLGGIEIIVQSLAELRNTYGSGHGKDAYFKGLGVRHARLAVGCSITFVEFVWSTYIQQK